LVGGPTAFVTYNFWNFKSAVSRVAVPEVTNAAVEFVIKCFIGDEFYVFLRNKIFIKIKFLT
jgi:hypothetical protein